MPGRIPSQQGRHVRCSFDAAMHRFVSTLLTLLAFPLAAAAQDDLLLQPRDDSFEARLAAGTAAVEAGEIQRAREHLRAASETWGADGRALTELAELAVREERWREADDRAQAALHRITINTPDHGPHQARAWAALGRARAELDEPAEAFEAYLRSLAFAPSRAIRRRARTLARRERRAGQPPLGAPERLVKRVGTPGPHSPCEALAARRAHVEAEGRETEDEYWLCEPVDQWRRHGVRWVTAFTGDWAGGDLTLWAETDAGWIRFHDLGQVWAGAFGGEYGVVEARAEAAIEWDGVHWVVLSTRATMVDHDGCEAGRTDSDRTHICTAEGEPRCLVVDGGTRSAVGPGRTQLFGDEEAAREECGTRPRGLRSADARLRSVAKLDPHRVVRVTVGRRGVRLSGPAAAPGLESWHSIGELWGWARYADQAGGGPPVLLGRGDALAEPTEPRPKPEPTIRPDLAEFLLPEPQAAAVDRSSDALAAP